jgi:hypothetical protein
MDATVGPGQVVGGNKMLEFRVATMITLHFFSLAAKQQLMEALPSAVTPSLCPQD